MRLRRSKGSLEYLLELGHLLECQAERESLLAEAEDADWNTDVSRD